MTCHLLRQPCTHHRKDEDDPTEMEQKKMFHAVELGEGGGIVPCQISAPLPIMKDATKAARNKRWQINMVGEGGDSPPLAKAGQ